MPWRSGLATAELPRHDSATGSAAAAGEAAAPGASPAAGWPAPSCLPPLASVPRPLTLSAAMTSERGDSACIAAESHRSLRIWCWFRSQDGVRQRVRHGLGHRRLERGVEGNVAASLGVKPARWHSAVSYTGHDSIRASQARGSRRFNRSARLGEEQKQQRVGIRAGSHGGRAAVRGCAVRVAAVAVGRTPMSEAPGRGRGSSSACVCT